MTRPPPPPIQYKYIIFISHNPGTMQADPPPGRFYQCTLGGKSSAFPPILLGTAGLRPPPPISKHPPPPAPLFGFFKKKNRWEKGGDIKRIVYT